jgi:hypothetical protein
MAGVLTTTPVVLSCALGLILFAGCVPGQISRPVALQTGDRQLEVGVFQDGRRVSPVLGAWKLKARPFELELSGDVRWASYHATAGDELAKKLAALDRPLVFFARTGLPAEGNGLHVLRGRAESDEAAELFVADELFFRRQWGANEPQSKELAARLLKAFGAVPAIACFGHFPFPSGSAKDSPRYFLRDATVTGGERVRGRFRVETLSEGSANRPLGALGRVHLLVFLETPVDPEFRRVTWSHLVLEFVPEGPAPGR